MVWDVQYDADVLPSAEGWNTIKSGFATESISNGKLLINSQANERILYFANEAYQLDVSILASMRPLKYGQDLDPPPNQFLMLERKGNGSKGCTATTGIINSITVRTVIFNGTSNLAINHTVSDLGFSYHDFYIEYVDDSGDNGTVNFYLDNVLLRTYSGVQFTFNPQTTVWFGHQNLATTQIQTSIDYVYYAQSLNTPAPLVKKPKILIDNRFNDGTIISSVSTEPGTSLTNLTDWRSYTLWQATIGTTTDQLITIDAGFFQNADTLAIAGHDLFTQNARISLESSSDNFVSIVDIEVPAFNPTSNKIIYKEFVKKSARYWRLKIAAGYAAPPFLAILIVGSRIDFERGLLGEYDDTGETAIAISQKSSTGNLLGTALSYIKKDISANTVISKVWFDDIFRPVWDIHISKHLPFVWVHNINDVTLAKITDSFKLSTPAITPDLRTMSLSLEGIANT